MKIRNGFVSNSSSTSFSIYGVYVEDSDALMNKLMGAPKSTKKPGCKHKFDRETAKFCPDCGEKAWNVEVEERDAYNDLPDCLEKLGLDVEIWNGGESCSEGSYVGKNLQDANFNKSKNKLEILKKVEEKLKELFPKVEPEFFSDAGYDG
jgi:hypothetical protein